jgi:cell division protein FtsI/penicillin-binding protein 2
MESGADMWQILQTSIGQGQTQITPVHNAMITAAIANGGILMKPYLIDRVENAGGDVIKKFMPQSYMNLMTAVEASELTGFMRSVVTEGTGSGLRTGAYTAAGKTGSAEFEKGKETHAWFVGFAPAEQPRVVVSVIAEESGSGGQAAVPIARAVFDVYFSRQ